jgi:hypothetical protein
MSGVALLLSSICLNATFCPNPQANPGVNAFETLPRDTQKTSEVISDELKKIAAELKGKTLNITTLEDYPLSYVEKDNVTQEYVGKGKTFTMKIKFSFLF